MAALTILRAACFAGSIVSFGLAFGYFRDGLATRGNVLDNARDQIADGNAPAHDGEGL